VEKNEEIKLSLILLISISLHTIFIVGIILPDNTDLIKYKGLKDKIFSGKDLIVNINQDERRIEGRETLLSDRDSSAKGFISKEKGDNWLNNSLDFTVKKGVKDRVSRSSSDRIDDENILLNDRSELFIKLKKSDSGGYIGEGGIYDFTRIPDLKGINRKNAIYYTNDGRFSFNTKKFKNFKYFKNLKDEIAAHWFPPVVANSVIGGYNPLSGSYTPGRVRILAIPSQEVKLYFTMNRKGDVLDVVIVESMGNKSLDSSCIDAIRLPMNYGKIPGDLKGNIIIIPFIFGYYVY